MPNTINLRLLDNKNIIAELNGIPLAQENSYKIIAGEENATNFKIASKPNQYINARYTVEMVNSQGFGVDETDIIEDTFSLPIGMAVAGYGYMQIRAYKGVEVIPFMTLKIKVWNTLPNWKDHISEGGASVNITIDSELSDTSTNPVQNKVVKQALDGKLDKAKGYKDRRAYTINEHSVLEMMPIRSKRGTPYSLVRRDNLQIDTELTPIDDSHVTSKKYVDDIKAELLEITAEKQALNKVNNKIKGLYSGLVQKEIYAVAEDVSMTEETRITGGSELDGLTVVDGSIATVKKIQGNTVVYERELKHAQISSIKGIGKNWFNPKFFANANWSQNSEGAWTGDLEKINTLYGNTTVGLFGSGLGIKEQVTISFTAKITKTIQQPAAPHGLSAFFVYTDGSISSINVNTENYTKYTLTSTSGKVIDKICLSYGTGSNITYVKDFQIEIGSTATEYKPYIESVVNLPQTMELGKWDYIENGKLVRATKTLDTNFWNTVKGAFLELETAYYIGYTLNTGNDGTAYTNIISNKLATTRSNEGIPSGYTEGIYLTGENYQIVGIWFSKEKYPNLNNLEAIEKYVKSLGLIASYELETPTITDFVFDNTYQVWNKGLEQIVSPKINDLNSFNYGANPTIENDYYILVGGAE